MLYQENLLVYLKNALELDGYSCDIIPITFMDNLKIDDIVKYDVIILDSTQLLQDYYSKYSSFKGYKCILLKPLGAKQSIFNGANVFEIFYPSKNLLQNIKQQVAIYSNQ